jgi:hypothetical protein
VFVAEELGNGNSDREMEDEAVQGCISGGGTDRMSAMFECNKDLPIVVESVARG